ncbi:uncharacterized protein EDB91DRAFT_1047044 [Suillus paluster]|uniref:uncharacterized protein n=1 Tax=Suillus paluster TaxID=48578 RepID=UPI001B85D3A8|nr:uncharacterized protein EDB91DRAFT_1047044 [Suillus paluster]KAG1749852.1 hypothetical protein EDB91DRAFT_1047044 [Suillus paluster]
MDEGLRYSSSRETAVGSSDEREKFEGTAEQGLCDGSLGASHPPPPTATRFSRLATSFRARTPRLYHAATRTVTYVRGPRPKIDLPNPVPLLGRTYTIKGRQFNVALEPAIIRFTRPLTAPWLLVLLVAAYIISFSFLVRAQWFLIPASSFVGCTSVYWTGDAGCGLNGALCEPFSNSSFDFRCPAQCNSVILQNPRVVGDVEVDFVPLLVGGGDSQKTYRADSFICASAVQAGLFSDSTGGCASINLVGNFTDYLPTTAFGLSSIGFPSTFPMSFRFSPSSILTHCTDLRTPALAFNILMTCLLFLVLRPRAIVMWWCLVCIGFWHIALFSQPQATPPPLDVAFGAFLPTLFVCYAFWRVAVRFTLPVFANAPFEAMIWYLAPYWTGVLTNLTMDQIPIERLTAADINQQPGGLVALIIIVLILFVLVVNQIRVIRKTGWLPYYLGWYILGGLVALVLALLPGLEFRLHHYIISMALFPGIGFPTRLSAIYQGFLLGMFLNGVAAFGFDSILQTAADLVEGGTTGSPLPTFLTNSTTYNASIALTNQTITWHNMPAAIANQGWNGFALLVDDVEVYIGTALNYSLAALEAGLPHFFRLGYTIGDTPGDFTMPVTLWPNGTWVNPLPGAS